MTVKIDHAHDALLIVDVQPDFMPGGGLAVAGGDEIVEPIAALLERRPVATIVATQDWHMAGHISFASSHAGKAPFEQIDLYGHPQMLWPDHCIQGTTGAELHPGLPTLPITTIIRKGTDPKVDSYSGFRENHGPGSGRPETGLAGLLRGRGVRRVLICGLALDVCVAWTALDAVDMGFESIVLRDLSRPVTTAGEAAELVRMQEAGVLVISSDELVIHSA